MYGFRIIDKDLYNSKMCLKNFLALSYCLFGSRCFQLISVLVSVSLYFLFPQLLSHSLSASLHVLVSLLIYLILNLFSHDASIQHVLIR